MKLIDVVTEGVAGTYVVSYAVGGFSNDKGFVLFKKPPTLNDQKLGLYVVASEKGWLSEEANDHLDRDEPLDLASLHDDPVSKDKATAMANRRVEQLERAEQLAMQYLWGRANITVIDLSRAYEINDAKQLPPHIKINSKSNDEF